MNTKYSMRCLHSDGTPVLGTGKGAYVPLIGIKTIRGAFNRIKLYNLNQGRRFIIEVNNSNHYYDMEGNLKWQE